jgi:alpha-tubulin suppressor-like RCC1 family protein
LNPYLYYLPIYQWQFNGTNIPFASGAGANVTFVPTFDGGTDAVGISNPAGSTNVTWPNVFLANPGMVEVWGENLHGECNRPLWLTNAISIAAGEWQSLAVTEAGSVVQWGDYYDKGNGNVFSVSNYSVASPAPTSNFVAVAPGMEQGLALMPNGTVFSWGLSNDSFGINWSIQQNLSNVAAIACGNAFDLALNNGTVVAWGDNSSGQTAVPPYLTNVVAIAAGSTYGLALQSNGTIVSWGTQPFGSTNVPSTLTNMAAIAAGYSHNLALQSNGTVVA